MAGEELATAGPREAEDVFQVRTRSRERARDGGIEWSPHGAEEQDACNARTDLESAVRDVLVRNPIAHDVKEQPERQRSEPRAEERTACCTCRHMERDDQAATLARATDRPPRADEEVFAAPTQSALLPSYSSWRRHHWYGLVCGYPSGESSHSSWRPRGVRSRKVQTLPSASTPRAVVKYVR
jgi:hypothetical protein